MYEEIDRSGQGKWILPTILGLVVIVGLLIVRFFGNPPEGTPYDIPADFVLLIGFAPFGSCFLGCLFGALRKRATKLNPDRLEFTDDVRNLDDFEKVYHEGDFKTRELGGRPVYACFLGITLMISIFLGIMSFYSMDVVGPVIASIMNVIFATILYIAGNVITFRGVPMGSKLVQNPLYHSIYRHLSKYDVLQGIARCDVVSSIIIRYKIGKGQTLKVIDDIHVLAVTATEPSLEVEITIEKMENIGPEYTYHLSEGPATNRDEMIDVAGQEVHLIVDKVDMNSFIRVRYDTGVPKARWNLGTSESLCDLMHALLDQVAKYVSFTIVPKMEDSGPNK